MEEYSFESVVRGIHVYHDIWEYKIGDKLVCKIEKKMRMIKSACESTGI